MGWDTKPKKREIAQLRGIHLHDACMQTGVEKGHLGLLVGEKCVEVEAAPAIAMGGMMDSRWAESAIVRKAAACAAEWFGCRAVSVAARSLVLRSESPSKLQAFYFKTITSVILYVRDIL